jgi:hypothetical protein
VHSVGFYAQRSLNCSGKENITTKEITFSLFNGDFLKCKQYVVRWEGHVSRMRKERVVYRVLVGKPEGKRPMGRPRRRWVDNIKTDLQEVGCGSMDWIEMAQDKDRWR